jgi:pyruvate ferredoxin oxidoreductase beta subunit
VEEYLVLQGRFRHLFEPVRKQDLIDEIQARVDVYWGRVEAAARGTET